MTWEQAYKILEPLADEDYIGGAWPPIRQHKMRAFFELAQGVKEGCIVELGTFRGLGAIALSLGASVPVYTVDDYKERQDYLGYGYTGIDNKRMIGRNIRLSRVIPGIIEMDVRAAADRFQKSVSLLVWDLGEAGRLQEDIAAWLPKLTDDAIVAVKDLETDGFGREQLETLGFTLTQEFPQGAVYAYQLQPQEHVFWIVDGDKYVTEAGRSAASVQKHMPHLEQVIYQPNTRQHAEFFIESTRLLVKVLEGLPEGARCLWLDSDTYMVQPVPELFQMLDRFDMVLAHAPGHVTAPTVKPIPACFPEFNIGVIALKNNIDTRSLWEKVYVNQVKHKDVYGDNDQAALREVLYQFIDDVQYAVMPCEYNFRFQFGGQVRDRVKILHGHARHAAEYELIGKSVNAGYVEGYQIAPRLWGGV